MIVDLKSRILLRPAVAAAEVGEHIEAVFDPSETCKRRRSTSRRNYDRHFAVAFDDIRHPRLVLFFQHFHISVELFSHIIILQQSTRTAR